MARTAFAQQPDIFSQEIPEQAPGRVVSPRFEKLGIEQGLSQSSILDMIQDRNGFMWFGTQGYDQAFGARPLRREIQNQIEDPLAERMLMASFESGDTIVIDADPDRGGLSIEKGSGKREPVKAGKSG